MLSVLHLVPMITLEAIVISNIFLHVQQLEGSKGQTQRMQSIKNTDLI